MSARDLCRYALPNLPFACQERWHKLSLLRTWLLSTPYNKANSFNREHGDRVSASARVLVHDHCFIGTALRAERHGASAVPLLSSHPSNGRPEARSRTIRVLLNFLSFLFLCFRIPGLLHLLGAWKVV